MLMYSQTFELCQPLQLSGRDEDGQPLFLNFGGKWRKICTIRHHFFDRLADLEEVEIVANSTIDEDGRGVISATLTDAASGV